MWFGCFNDFGWTGMILNLVLMIGVIVGIILLIVWAVRRVGDGSSQPVSRNQAGQSARDIAQLRYAKGEITREEYQQILKDLGQ